jgi:outer membrane receptor protein involved in Fe transport
MGKTGKSMSLLLLILLSALATASLPLQAAGKGGVVSGKLVDAETGEAVIGAAIQVEGTTIGNTSDIDGNFIIRNVSVGTHSIIVQCIGYAQTRIQDVQISAKEAIELNLSLSREVLEAGFVVEVTAEALQNNEASLLRERRLSNVISDAISAEAISRSGSSDAASAIKKVTGVSVVGDKHVYVRGLGDRYVSTNLNGSALPSVDPDKQSFPIDMIPASLLDKIVVEKTFTPDKPANFAGGSVNFATKELPGKRVLQFSSSQGYNSQATWNDNFLTHTGGDHDWLGSDDGSRALPAIVYGSQAEVPPLTIARRDSAQALYLDEISKAFSDEMSPTRRRAPQDQSYKLSYGDVFSLWDRAVSLISSVSYKRSYSFYEEGTVARWDRAAADVMDDQLALADSRSVEEILWGGMLNLRIPLATKHKLVFDYMYSRNAEDESRNAEDESRYLIGHFDEALSEEQTFETRVLRYIERSSGTLQLSGKHKFGESGQAFQMDWRLSGSNVNQSEPDFRFFSNNYRVIEFTLPFRQWSDQQAKLKLGTAFLRKNRDFLERRFEIWWDQSKRYGGDPDVFVADANMGIKEIRNGQYIFNNYMYENVAAGTAYDSWQEVAAAYLMTDLPLTRSLSAVTGVRYERTLMHTRGEQREGEISANDFLPSIGLTYRLGETTNLRASYGKTLARPSLREFAPFASFSYANGYLLHGNPELEPTMIDNYDLRFEIFPRPNELAAVSLFYRYFKNPIEQAMLNGNGWVQFENVDRAKMFGVELEVRKNLDLLPGQLANLNVGANLTLIKTEVRIPEIDLHVRRAYDPDASDTRAMQGQPEYVVNANLDYINSNSGTTAGLIFNVLGRQIASVSLDATPDLYQLPEPQLDLVASQELGWKMKASAKIKNVLNSEHSEVHPFQGEDYVASSYQKGVSFSLGLSWSL